MNLETSSASALPSAADMSSQAGIWASTAMSSAVDAVWAQKEQLSRLAAETPWSAFGNLPADTLAASDGGSTEAVDASPAAPSDGRSSEQTLASPSQDSTWP